jgi:pimeloyl-ACP methyl ester carboxylesterase
MAWADVNGARLYYEVAGEGHPLVLIHAGIAGSRMWDDQVAAFTHAFRVVRYDLRGFGQSEMPPAPFAHYADLHGLLTALGIERASLLGSSLGGATAIDATLAYPALADALILVASALSGYTFSAKTRRKWAAIDAALEREGVAQAVELELRMWVDGPLRTPEQVDPAVRERVRAMDSRAYALYTEAATEQALEPPASARLAEIRVPTLIVVGEGDVPDILACSTVLEEGIAGARKVVLPGTAHMLNMEQPDAFNRVALDFLRTP